MRLGLSVVVALLLLTQANATWEQPVVALGIRV